MKQVKYRTYSLPKEAVKRNWHLIDAQGQLLGKVAVQIADHLQGKKKLDFTPHTDNGDYVVVINAGEIGVTGKKEQHKMYYRHTNYPGGFRQETLAELRARRPEQIIKLAVQNMLPKNRTRSDRLARLKIFVGAEHPYTKLVTSKE